MKFSEKYLLNSYDDVYNEIKKEIITHHNGIIENQLKIIKKEKARADYSKISMREDAIARCLKSLDNIEETLIGVIGNRGYFLYTLVEKMNAWFPDRKYNKNNHDVFDALCNQIKTAVDGFGKYSLDLYNDITKIPNYKSDLALKKLGRLYNKELLTPKEIELAIAKLSNSPKDLIKNAEIYLIAGYLTPDDILMETKQEYINYDKKQIRYFKF